MQLLAPYDQLHRLPIAHSDVFNVEPYPFPGTQLAADTQKPQPGSEVHCRQPDSRAHRCTGQELASVTHSGVVRGDLEHCSALELRSAARKQLPVGSGNGQAVTR